MKTFKQYLNEKYGKTKILPDVKKKKGDPKKYKWKADNPQANTHSIGPRNSVSVY